MKLLTKTAKFLFCCLVVGCSLYIPVQAQRVPIALKDSSVLSPTNSADYQQAASEYKRERTPERRNRLIFMAVSQIDLNFGFYQKNRRYKNNLFQTVLDILEVGAATAISITNGERPKSIIADALGFVQGSRSRINKNLHLLEQQVLFNKMIENRARVLTRILDNTGRFNDAQYPFERAYLDIVAYYEAGTMDSALSSLATDTGASAQNAERQLAQAKRKAGIILAPTEAQIRVSRQNSDFVQAIVDRHATAAAQITDAERRIGEADAIINQQPQANAEALAQARTNRTNAETDKRNAQAVQKKALDDLRAIFQSIEDDPQLSPLLEELPERFPNLASKIEARLARIRSNQGTIDDYGLTILQFLRGVVDAVPDNPNIVERTKVILDSVR
ncbi:MAG: hypothetical protein M3384_04500 [Acidobacteriota bacterium]|nr:hypothetical protein [Acidobacteriota bacterium]